MGRMDPPFTAPNAWCHGASGDGNSAVLADVVPALSDEELEDVFETAQIPECLLHGDR